MPNWVFNTISEYTPDLHDKYKSEKHEIDFDKIIPEPEEIKSAPSCSYNDVAKEIVKYKEYKTDRDKHISFKNDYKNPLHDRINREAERTYIEVGKVSIEEPNETLNNLLEKPHNKTAKHFYDDYVEVFGNKTLDHIPNNEMECCYDKYCEVKDSKYQEFINPDIDPEITYPNTIEDLGNVLLKCKEKYGFDNWYDWRVANWGTKWNACETEYDEEGNVLRFDTAWAIPYQIISKIAQENPEAKLDGYSEEEQGWFDEYYTDNGKVHITCHGDIEYEESESGDEEIKFNREYCNESFDYDECVKKETEYWSNVANNRKLIY